MKDIVISVEHVYKDFNGEQVLTDVNHQFEAGKIHGIVGNNGSGKTVLFKCMCGFLFPTKGKIFIDYEQVGVDMDFPDDMGIIIETPGFLPNVSGLKNLQILAGLKRKIGNKEIRQTMRQVSLDPDMKKHVGKYSLGMRQRLGIAQAIMEDPMYLILDEPFNGLDKHGVQEMRELIKGLREQGKTILLASHNAHDIDELCDTVCEMDAGVLTVVRETKESARVDKVIPLAARR
jgi:ABC-2 type transport system ATP-binding protein